MGISEESSGGYTVYTSPDIWIDSQENGWDVYPQGESFTYEAGISVPSGYGDPFWVNHENRIHFLDRERVHHERARTQIGLQKAAAAHICHLVSGNHILGLFGAFSIAKPEVDANVGITWGLDP